MKNFTDLEAQIADLNTQRREWKWAPDNPLSSLNERIFRALDEVCDAYLRGTPGQRERIRSVLAENTAVSGYLAGYLSGGIQQIQSLKDPKWLSLGLVAASIGDLDGDYRDWIVLLGDLYLAAARSGIDPMPYFKAIGSISNPKDPNGIGSTRNLLENYDRTAYFAETIKPELDKLRNGPSS